MLVASSILAFGPSAQASEPVVVNALEVLSLQINFNLQDSVAATHLALLVKNPGNVSREAALALPLSSNAVLTGMTLTTHNRTLVGVVTERNVASATYEASKERGEDAVLLDSAGHGLLSIRINVAAGGTVRLDAVYAELLPLDLGIREYVFPAARLQADLRNVAHYRVNGTIVSSVPWSSINGEGVPSSIAQASNRSATWVYDDENVQVSQDLALRIKPILTGYASSMVLSGKEDEAVFAATILPPGLGDPLPVDVVFVIDHSGSMAGAKMEQAKEAVDTILGQLRTQDRFGIVAFDDAIDKHQSAMVSASSSNVDGGQGWVNEIQADGSTNIEGGVSAALDILGTQERAALPMVVLITDGLPTAGITGHRQIIESVDQKNMLDARVHVVGIGFDKDNAFLAELAASQRGFYRPLDPASDVAAALEDFYAAIASPLLKDISVEFVGLEALDVHPAPFPDLYRGSELVVAGRANTTALPSVVKVVLKGTSTAGAFTREISIETATMPIRPEVEKLWARQKANTLERYIQLHQASENVSTQQAELLAHGLRYQIETLRTSWVIVPIGEVANTTAEAYHDTRSYLDYAQSGPGGAMAGAPTAVAPNAPPGAPPAAPPGAAPALGGTSAGAPTMTRTPGPNLVIGVLAIVAVAFVIARRHRDEQA